MSRNLIRSVITGVKRALPDVPASTSQGSNSTKQTSPGTEIASEASSQPRTVERGSSSYKWTPLKNAASLPKNEAKLPPDQNAPKASPITGQPLAFAPSTTASYRFIEAPVDPTSAKDGDYEPIDHLAPPPELVNNFPSPDLLREIDQVALSELQTALNKLTALNAKIKKTVSGMSGKTQDPETGIPGYINADIHTKTTPVLETLKELNAHAEHMKMHLFDLMTMPYTQDRDMMKEFRDEVKQMSEEEARELLEELEEKQTRDVNLVMTRAQNLEEQARRIKVHRDDSRPTTRKQR